MSVSLTLRVTSIRSQNPRGFGGCIFAGSAIDETGSNLDARNFYVVKATATTLGGATVALGQWWRVSGEVSSRMSAVNGHQIAELQVDALSASLVRPSGEHIVAFLADNSDFEGIGTVKAQKLWDAFGVRLYGHLDNADVRELSAVLSPASAAQVVAAWAKQGDSQMLQWLQARGFDVAFGRKVMQYFGAEMAEKLEEDPYRLLSFGASWRDVDALARSHFDVALDDPRRLLGAVEEACYRLFAIGHTTVLSSKLMVHLRAVLGAQTRTFQWRSLVPSALSQGLSNGSFVVSLHGIQPLGAMVMERQVAKAVADRMRQQGQVLLETDQVDAVLRSYENTEGIVLNPQQVRAVHLASSSAMALIVGGAGVGKTTVLKALYEVYDRVGVDVVQLALAGRAAKRMQEATGRPAFTIASFLGNWKRGESEKRCAVVVDEASMVDIITMNRLCELLEGQVRLVMVGDSAQLMPVGPGLVLHALARVQHVPTAELTIVKRHGGAIAAAAASIREGTWPELGDNLTAPIAFIPCPASAGGGASTGIAETVLRLYMEHPKSTQILCARRNGPDGTKSLNALCQSTLTVQARPIEQWDKRHEAYARFGFHAGDPVLCTRNLWDLGLQNGSLGVISEVEAARPPLTDDDEGEGARTLAWVDWDDGIRRPLVMEMLGDLELGYAITVHKAQGSQWPRVIVPLTSHRLLDRTLVYTAVTRAQQQVLLVGDESAARAAVEGLPRAQSRQISLDLWLTRLLVSE